MNFKCLIDGRIMEIADVTDKHLKKEFEQGLNLFLKRILKLNSLPKHQTNVLAYFENGKLRCRVNLQKAN